MKRWIRITVRTVIIALLITATVDVHLPSQRALGTRVYLIDVSSSVGRQASNDALRAFEASQKKYGGPGSFIAFGVRPVPFQGTLPSIEMDHTNLGAALESALALAGENGEIILATDGRDTSDTLERSLHLASAQNIPIHLLPTGPHHPIDVRIAAVDLPTTVPPGTTFDARVTLQSSGAAQGTLNGVPWVFATASSQIVVLHDLPAQTPLRIRLDVQDICPENNSVDIDVLIRTDQPRVRAPSHVAPLLPSTWTVAPEGDPTTFDAVIIDRLDPTIAPAVTQHGVGLIVLGGPDSYAPGRFSGSPLEEILPVWPFPDERNAIFFVLDSSGSMDQELPGLGRRIDIATSALSKALSLLYREDRWGLISFSEQPRTDIPLRTGVALFPRIVPGGPTRIIPALDHALTELLAQPQGKRHLVLLTDGVTQETDEDLAQVGRRIAGRDVRLTILATTPEGHSKLARLGGTLVPAHDPTRLTETLKAALGQSLEIVIDNAPLTAHDHSLLSGLPPWPATLPRINRTTAKPTAELLVTSGRAPVLAMGWAGRGRVVAAMFGLHEGWAGSLESWAGLPLLLARLVETVAPPAPGIISTTVRQEDNDVVFSVRSRSTEDELDTHPVRLQRRGPRLFEGRVPATVGTHVLRLAGRAIASITVPHSREFTAFGPDVDTLTHIARSTGGQLLSRTSDIETLPPRLRTTTRSGRALFLILAIVLFIGDLALFTFWRVV